VVDLHVVDLKRDVDGYFLRPLRKRSAGPPEMRGLGRAIRYGWALGASAAGSRPEVHALQADAAICAPRSAGDECMEVQVEAIHMGEHETVWSALIDGQPAPGDQPGRPLTRQGKGC
jgi:hypothetical protein